MNNLEILDGRLSDSTMKIEHVRLSVCDTQTDTDKTSIGPIGNYLHWYRQQKITAKSIKPTQIQPKKNNNILPTYTCTQT